MHQNNTNNGPHHLRKFATIMESPKKITVVVEVNASPEKAWQYFTEPDHLTNWYFASDDWHAPHAENDLRVDGRFKIAMAAKNGSAGFDFEGVYTEVEPTTYLSFTLDDNRKVSVAFESADGKTIVTETFEAESMHPVEMQQQGWQAILNNFKKYTEEN